MIIPQSFIYALVIIGTKLPELEEKPNAKD